VVNLDKFVHSKTTHKYFAGHFLIAVTKATMPLLSQSPPATLQRLTCTEKRGSGAGTTSFDRRASE